MIPIAKPYLDDSEAKEVSRVLASGWISQGPETAKFEKEWAEYTGANFAIAVSNCTAALHLSLIALGIGTGDEVIVPSHTFIATANAVRMTGAKPVFVDIDVKTFNIDPKLIEAAINSKTAAVMPVHQFGMPVDIGPISMIAANHDLRLIEDAACASGSRFELDGSWQRIGGPIGDVACFSFHPRKVLSTGEGGMITTNNREIAERLSRLRQHAMSVNAATRHSSDEVIIESYDELGYNYKLPDILAAVGRVQLRKLDSMIERRRAIAARYNEYLANIEYVSAPYEPRWAASNWQSYCVTLDPTIDRLSVIKSLRKSGVATRPGMMNTHLEPPYRDDSLVLTNSVFVQENCIMLPIYHELSDENIDTVVGSLEN